jgi:hypothetical protein
MKTALTLALILTASWAWGQDSERIATPTYWSAVGVAAGVTAVDAFTTVANVGPHSRTCPVEVYSPWLYGSQPSAGRTAALMAGEVFLSSFAAYEIKRRGHRRLWLTPLAWTAVTHARGTINNLSRCTQ